MKKFPLLLDEILELPVDERLPLAQSTLGFEGLLQSTVQGCFDLLTDPDALFDRLDLRLPPDVLRLPTRILQRNIALPDCGEGQRSLLSPHERAAEGDP